MKKYLLLLFILIAFLEGCRKQDLTTTTPIDEMVDTTQAQIKKMGQFSNGPYGRVSGMARVYLQNNQLVLVLENMMISNGPDLHVYLSKEADPLNFIDLGKLKSTNGNQVYEIPISTNLSIYKFALVHCQLYNHLFGKAELE
jgi:hypothetical protein